MAVASQTVAKKGVKVAMLHTWAATAASLQLIEELHNADQQQLCAHLQQAKMAMRCSIVHRASAMLVPGGQLGSSSNELLCLRLHRIRTSADS